MHALVVAGTHSGVGKTSVILGLIAALRRRGLVVQPFKVGPDFIDPQHHARAAGRPCHNLDGWMLPREANLELFARHSAGADVAVIEGMMGLFDGADARSNGGSAAEMASWLGAPVLLVVDASAMARSTAALVHGYATFDPGLRLAGVVANRVGSAGHAGLIEQALAGRHELVGWLATDPDVAVPERHLGLHLPDPASDRRVDVLADAVEANFDLDGLLRASEHDRPAYPAASTTAAGERVRIGVARDEAFSFYYEDNLALLEEAGAELVEFSPLAGTLPAGLGGLYLGGGYPELHAAGLERNLAMRTAVRELAERGAPIYAECGGLIYLGKAIEVDGEHHELCGSIAVETAFPGPLELGYCEVVTEPASLFGGAQRARGHWFHRGRIAASAEPSRAYRVTRGGAQPFPDGYVAGSVQASWVHLHFRSSPGLAAAFVERCRRAVSGPAAPSSP
jgi:cobyrinic acid a,c-diamide synthase